MYCMCVHIYECMLCFFSEHQTQATMNRSDQLFLAYHTRKYFSWQCVLACVNVLHLCSSPCVYTVYFIRASDAGYNESFRPADLGLPELKPEQRIPQWKKDRDKKKSKGDGAGLYNGHFSFDL